MTENAIWQALEDITSATLIWLKESLRAKNSTQTSITKLFSEEQKDKTWEKKVTLIIQDMKNGKRIDTNLIHITLLCKF